MPNSRRSSATGAGGSGGGRIVTTAMAAGAGENQSANSADRHKRRTARGAKSEAKEV